MKLAQWMVVMLAVSLLAAGCGDKDQDKAKSGGAAGKGGSPAPAAAASPKDVLEAMHKASQAKDMNALVSYMDPALQPPMKDMLSMLEEMKTKTNALAKVVEEKIGKPQADRIRQQGAMEDKDISPLAKAVENGQVNWSKIDIKEEGDKATVKVQGDEPFMIKKVNGKWYAFPPEKENLTPEKMQTQVDAMKKMMTPMGKAYDEVAKKINAGTITKENFDAEYGKTMAAAMMGAAPKDE